MGRFKLICAEDPEWGPSGASEHCGINAIVDVSTSPPTFVGGDGGEPEDQLLFRHWDWVLPALNKAYADGVAEGFRRGLNADPKAIWNELSNIADEEGRGE